MSKGKILMQIWKYTFSKHSKSLSWKQTLCFNCKAAAAGDVAGDVIDKIEKFMEQRVSAITDFKLS